MISETTGAPGVWSTHPLLLRWSIRGGHFRLERDQAPYPRETWDGPYGCKEVLPALMCGARAHLGALPRGEQAAM